MPPGMPKLRRIKGKGGKLKGSYRVTWQGKDWNLGTSNSDEAIRRRRDLMSGVWRPDGERGDPLDALEGAEAPPAPPATVFEAATVVIDGPPAPADTVPELTPAGESVSADLSDEAAAVVAGDAEAAAPPVSPAGVSMDAILKAIGIKDVEELYAKAGHVGVGVVLWTEGRITKRITKVEPPPLLMDESEIGKLTTLVRGFTDACATEEIKRLVPNLTNIPTGWGCAIGCTLLGLLQFAGARELAAAQRKGQPASDPEVAPQAAA